MGSTRLPGKVMEPLAGRPMIGHVVERARHIPSVDQVVVATSTLKHEQPLINYLVQQSVPVFCGPEEDVLARYYEAALEHAADVIVRITADCPLLSPQVSERVVAAYQKQQCDYVSNTIERTYPRGLDTEVLSFEALEHSHHAATHPAEREHVTRHILQRLTSFRHHAVTDDIDRSNLRWTVDETDDLTFARKVFAALYSQKPTFEYQDVLALLDEHPEWAQINQHVEQKKL